MTPAARVSHLYFPVKRTSRPRMVKKVVFADVVERVRVVSTVEVVWSVTGSVTVTKAVATSSTDEEKEERRAVGGQPSMGTSADSEQASAPSALRLAEANALLLLLLVAKSPVVALVTVMKVVFPEAVGTEAALPSVRVLVGVTVVYSVVVEMIVVVDVPSVEELDPSADGNVVYVLPVMV